MSAHVANLNVKSQFFQLGTCLHCTKLLVRGGTLHAIHLAGLSITAISCCSYMSTKPFTGFQRAT